MNGRNIVFLNELEDIIRRRLNDRPDSSYTARLVAGGDKRVAQKVGEEAVELALASVAGTRKEQIDEAADLLFHTLVLLNCMGISLTDVVDILKERHDG